MVVPNTLTLAPGRAWLSQCRPLALPSDDYAATVQVTDNFRLIHNVGLDLTNSVLSSEANDTTPPTLRDLLAVPRKATGIADMGQFDGQHAVKLTWCARRRVGKADEKEIQSRFD